MSTQELTTLCRWIADLSRAGFRVRVNGGGARLERQTIGGIERRWLTLDMVRQVIQGEVR